ncbi:uncharacterized protein [Dermacentor andersoni]|uniref:uncharacterized protein isoform X1 n=2 Tax=Dermacentor andersoni TaxID=34620 RepID=UPI002155CBBC|nr:uncharacterized protein LOC126529350 isoform X1 [Dermacentor andersoni]
MSKPPKTASKWMPTSVAVPKILTIAEELSCSCGQTESGSLGSGRKSYSSRSRSSDPTRPTVAAGPIHRYPISDLGSARRRGGGGGAAVALEDFDGVEDILAVRACGSPLEDTASPYSTGPYLRCSRS